MWSEFRFLSDRHLMAADPRRRRRTDVEPLEPPVERPGRFRFEDLDFGLDMLARCLCHPVSRRVGWSSWRHFGLCGQSCPCCRYAAGDAFGVCKFCPTTFAMRAASRAMKEFVGRHMSKGMLLARDPGPD